MFPVWLVFTSNLNSQATWLKVKSCKLLSYNGLRPSARWVNWTLPVGWILPARWKNIHSFRKISVISISKSICLDAPLTWCSVYCRFDLPVLGFSSAAHVLWIRLYNPIRFQDKERKKIAGLPWWRYWLSVCGRWCMNFHYLEGIDDYRFTMTIRWTSELRMWNCFS